MKKKTMRNGERIRLSGMEKFTLLSVRDHGEEQPEDISKSDFYLALTTLQDKGLVSIKTNYEEILGARLTVMGTYYIKHNPKLRNPVDWGRILVIVFTGITAAAAVLALFIACGKLL